MPTKTTTRRSAQSKPSAAKAPAARSAPAKAPARLSLREVMGILEKLGTEQTRKTWARHGATGPMFGVLFGAVDHGDTACETPDVAEQLDKVWARSGAKFGSPAAHERSMKSMRRRC